MSPSSLGHYRLSEKAFNKYGMPSQPALSSINKVWIQDEQRVQCPLNGMHGSVTSLLPLPLLLQAETVLLGGSHQGQHWGELKGSSSSRETICENDLPPPCTQGSFPQDPTSKPHNDASASKQL